MARRFNVDKITSLHETISFDFKGKEHVVLETTDEIIQEITRLGNSGDPLGEILAAQLAAHTGEDVEEFKDMTIREMAGVVQHITESMSDPTGKGRSGRNR